MTENEAIKILKRDLKIQQDNKTLIDGIEALQVAIKALEEKTMLNEIMHELSEYQAIGTVKEVRMLKDYKELYDVYKLIGTIEEFRNLKYKKNVLPIATIEFSKEDMQKIVDEKVAQIELDIQEIRANAIDEFAERLKSDKFQKYDLDMVFETSRDLSYSDCIDAFHEYIEEIAGQMKGEQNERLQ